MFGSLPEGDLIGIGLNSSQHQRELIEHRRKGLGGQENGHNNKYSKINDT